MNFSLPLETAEAIREIVQATSCASRPLFPLEMSPPPVGSAAPLRTSPLRVEMAALNLCVSCCLEAY